MTSKEFNNEKLYQTTMSLMRSLLMQGAITQKEYCRIDTIFLEIASNAGGDNSKRVLSH